MKETDYQQPCVRCMHFTTCCSCVSYDIKNLIVNRLFRTLILGDDDCFSGGKESGTK